MSRKDLVETALHVLVAWTDRRIPASADLATLKGAFPSLAHLDPDQLACAVINRFSPQLSDDHPRDGNADFVIDDVA